MRLNRFDVNSKEPQFCQLILLDPFSLLSHFDCLIQRLLFNFKALNVKMGEENKRSI